MPTKAIVLLEAEMNIGGIAMNIQTIVAMSFETSSWHPYSFRLLGMVLVHSYTDDRRDYIDLPIHLPCHSPVYLHVAEAHAAASVP